MITKSEKVLLKSTTLATLARMLTLYTLGGVVTKCSGVSTVNNHDRFGLRISGRGFIGLNLKAPYTMVNRLWYN